MSEEIYTIAEEKGIIAGDDYPLWFKVVSDTGTAVNLSAANTQIKFVLCSYNCPSMNILDYSNSNSAQIEVNTDDTSEFVVHLNHAATSDFMGGYTYQVEITSPAGVVSRRLQGDLMYRAKNQGGS